eukprot:3166995-Pyramimonas_sp.AAC.1
MRNIRDLNVVALNCSGVSAAEYAFVLQSMEFVWDVLLLREFTAVGDGGIFDVDGRAILASPCQCGVRGCAVVIHRRRATGLEQARVNSDSRVMVAHLSVGSAKFCLASGCLPQKHSDEDFFERANEVFTHVISESRDSEILVLSVDSNCEFGESLYSVESDVIG